MNLKLYKNNVNLYLSSSEIIDFYNEDIIKTADEIFDYSADSIDYIKNAYEYVRDTIGHSADINNNIITCKASEVLKERHGICFAKSHLLAALLRYKFIPTGFCYQKLILDDETAPFLIIHGLNGVYIEKYNKWIRLDARGNKQGVNAQFDIDNECLAFPVRKEKGEQDIPFIYPNPDKNIILTLTNNKTRIQLWNNLPEELYYLQIK